VAVLRIFPHEILDLDLQGVGDPVEHAERRAVRRCQDPPELCAGHPRPIGDVTQGDTP
jgi:hypothetical protein